MGEKPKTCCTPVIVAGQGFRTRAVTAAAADTLAVAGRGRMAGQFVGLHMLWNSGSLDIYMVKVKCIGYGVVSDLC